MFTLLVRHPDLSKFLLPYWSISILLCSAFLYDSNPSEGTANNKNGSKGSNRHPELRSTIIAQAMQEFVQKEEEAAQGAPQSLEVPHSNLSGALSMALCCIQPTNSSSQFLTAWMYILNVLPLAYTEVGYFEVLASLQ